MEEAQQASAALVSQGYANDYEDRFPATYGGKLGILTNSLNTPIQDLNLTGSVLDLVTTNSIFTAHLSTSEKITGTG